ncbi:MFS transporter [Pantoea sp. B65]|uniref:MFS transporter n=1 Tax=Pantoea sp. B65 TaxID=2813359 RepID=UPI0039B40747
MNQTLTDSQKRLPVTRLLALALTGFITILTEALPAGLLPQISQDLHVSPALAGQLVTLYAIGSLLAAIPLTIITQGIGRRTLLLLAIGGFAVVNSITALSGSYLLTLVARFVAGVCAGLVWALIAGYAARMVPERLKGRAIAVAMVGTPLALSLGIPLGTFIGAIIGWRVTFALISLLTLLLIGWVRVKLPDYPGQLAAQRLSLRQVFILPGVRPVLLVTLGFVLAHNILYTYIAPLLAPLGMALQIDRVLLLFGVAAFGGIVIIGILIDRGIRQLVLGSIVLFAAAALLLGLCAAMPLAVWLAIGLWGLAFGGVSTLFQTALADSAGAAADVAQSMLVTCWNIAIAAGGIIGGVLLEGGGVQTLPWAVLALMALTLLVAGNAQRHGFPPPGLVDHK